MKNIVQKILWALLATWGLLSCSATPAGRPLAAEYRGAVIGTVDVVFQIQIGSSRRTIMATAHDKLLERARLLYGNNVDIRNIETTRGAAALGMMVMHGTDMITATGTVISLDLQMARARTRATEYALREVRRVFPADARVWIHNNAIADQGLAGDVIDDMTSAFLRNNITVVERGLVNLIALEQGIHLDGFVPDSDFISIGNAAGANTIIVVDIVGAGALRRLSIRVLDIATGTVRMQSDTGEAWRL